MMKSWGPTGKARGNSIVYPATARLWGGYPPSAKSAVAAILAAMNNSDIVDAFIHGQCPWFAA